MRTGLTVFAILVIWILTAALVGPYFVDWNQQRAVVEAQLTRVLGGRVTVQGAIDLRLLPTPYITLSQVEVADSNTGGVLFSCDAVELALALTSLARGEFRFTQASFAHPTIDLERGADGRILLPNLNVAPRSGSIAFDRVVVRNGRVRIAPTEGGVKLDVGGVDLDAEAGSLLGPFKGSGAVPGPGGAKVSFNFASGVAEGANLRFKAVFDAGTGLPRAELEGALAFATPTPTSGLGAVGYFGAATFTGLIKGDGAPTPWRASGALKADLRGASLDSLEIRLGQEDRSLAANGSARAEFGAVTDVKVVLEAKQLNVDALLRSEGQESATPTQAYESLRAALAGLGAESALPASISLELSTPAAILGGDTVADFSLSATASPNAPIVGKIEASPPGRSHILASGTVDLGIAPVFKGRVDASIGDTHRLSEWLALGAPDLAARFDAFTGMLPYRSAAAVGDVEMSAAGFAARNLRLTLERSTFAGALVMTRPVGADRGRVFMDLQTDSLDIDSLPNIGASGNFVRDVDLSLALDAHAIRIARLGEAQVEGGSLTLKLTKQGDDIRLDRFAVADLGGASLEANGAVDATGRQLTAKIDAQELRDFALLVRRVAPGPFSDMLADRAGALSPAKLAFHLSGQGRDVGAPPDLLTVEGVAGVTHVSAKLNRVAGDAGAVDAAISLDAPDAAPLLRQFGLPALSLAGLGRGHISASAHGGWGEELNGDLAASLAGADLAWHGRFSHALEASGAWLEGAASVKSSNAMSLLAVLGVAAPDAPPIATDLAAQIAWRDDRFAFSQLQGTVGRARFSGALTYRPAEAQPAPAIAADPDIALAQSIAADNSEGPPPQVEGDLTVDRLSLSALSGLALGASQAAKASAPWSDARFLVGLIDPPTAKVALRIAALDILDDLPARDARLQLKIGRDVVSLDEVSMRVGGAGVAGRATIRRDGANASLSGQASIEPVAFERPYFTGRLSGSMDFATSGQSAAALAAGLAGTGAFRLSGARLAHLDQDALGRIIEKAQSSDYPVDQTNISHALDLEFNKQPLPIADADAQASLTAGVIRVGPFEARDAKDDALLRASFDLRSLLLEIHVGLTELRTPKYWSGAPPAVNVILRGSLETMAREIDSSLFVAGLAAQAIARETDRIAAAESDIRERAFFNRRLKAGQFMRRRELELSAYALEQARLKSETDRRRVEAEALRADDDRRRASPPPALPPAATPAPDELQPPPPRPQPRPQSAPQQTDPTAGGLY